jgi:hypothetical protein
VSVVYLSNQLWIPIYWLLTQKFRHENTTVECPCVPAYKKNKFSYLVERYMKLIFKIVLQGQT